MVNGSIPIHPERGLDPHLCVCPICGKRTNELTVGEMYVGKTPTGQRVYFMRGARRKVEKEIGRQLTGIRAVRENEEIPGNPCDECEDERKAEQDREMAAMKAGGIAFRCGVCHLQGVIRRSETAAEICDAVRDAHGKPFNPDGDSEPCGIMFETCEQHENMGILAPGKAGSHG